MTSMTIHQRPVTEAPSPWAFPAFTEAALGSGLRVLHRHIPGQQLIAVTVVIPAPATSEPAGMAGIGSTLATAMTQGAGTLDTHAFSAALEGTGASFSVSADLAGLRADLTVAASRLTSALPLLTQALAEPTLESSVVERVVGQQSARLRNAAAQAGWVAERALAQAIYGTHRLAAGESGTTATLSAVTPDAVRSYAASVLVPSSATVIVAGDFTGLGDVVALLEQTLSRWPGTAHPPQTLALPPSGAPSLVIADLPGAVQTAFAMAAPGSRRRQPGWEADILAGYILGGPLTSRLSMVLREEKGYTYGIGAGVLAQGPLSRRRINTSVETGVTGAALTEIMDLTARYAAEGPTEHELHNAVTAKVAVAPLKLQTAGDLVREVATAVVDGLPLSWTEQQYVRLNATTLDQVAAAAAGWKGSDFTIVACGDAALISEQLEGSGFDSFTVTTVTP